MTKRQLKKLNGMNAATQANYEAGFAPPMYANIHAKNPTLQPHFIKVAKGVPYVNINNFL